MGGTAAPVGQECPVLSPRSALVKGGCMESPAGDGDVCLPVAVAVLGRVCGPGSLARLPKEEGRAGEAVTRERESGRRRSLSLRLF